jgi:hypothetical protein
MALLRRLRQVPEAPSVRRNAANLPGGRKGRDSKWVSYVDGAMPLPFGDHPR